MAKIKGGYYIKARCVQESEIATAPPHIRETWDWFLRKANHSTEKRYGHVLERGQLLCTYSDILEGLHWMVGWRKQTYTKGNCETAMKYLKKTGRVTTRKTTRGMVVTLCNYEYYQNPKNYENRKEKATQPTGKGKQHDSIDKNVKKEEERKELYARFSQKFWELYPKRNNKKIGKQPCFEWIDKNIEETDFQLLLRATKNYADSKGAKDNYAKDPIRFLNTSLWKDWEEPESGGNGRDNNFVLSTKTPCRQCHSITYHGQSDGVCDDCTASLRHNA